MNPFGITRTILEFNGVMDILFKEGFGKDETINQIYILPNG